MAVKIQLRRGTEAEFDSANSTSTITPADGEVLVVQESGTTGGYLLIGDGSTNYLTLKGDEDGRVYFKPGYSKTVMGGEQPAGDTPLTVKGATSQSVPIFVVEDKTGNDIFKVSDDESSGSAALVAVESHGQTADVVMSVMGQADQDADGSGGDLLRVQPDVGHTGKGLVVDHSGNVVIVPIDDSDNNNDTALKIVASSDNDNPIMRVQDKDGTDLFKIAVTATQHIKALNLGNTPSHADPTNFGVLRTGTTPNNTDSGAADEHIDQPHFQMFAHGSGTNMRGTLILCANSAVDGSGVAFGVRKSGNSGNLATIFYNGKGEFSDGTITTTGRTLADASILRADEIRRFIDPFKYTTDTYTDSDYNSNVEHLLPLDVASSSHDFASKTSFPNQPNLTLVPISGTNASPDTNEQFGTGTGDTTNAHLLKIPPNSGLLSLKITLTSGQVFFGGSGNLNVTGGEAKFYSYTAQTATSSDNKTQLGGVVATLVAGSTTATVVGTVNVANSTVEKFVAVSFNGNHNTSGSDSLAYTFEVSREGNTVAL